MKLVIRKIPVTQIDHEETGRTARRNRKGEGFSLRAVAREMGFTAPYISDLERGRRTWSDKLLTAYMNALMNLRVAAIRKAMKKKGPNLFIGSKKC